jgi:hypothetical protein
MKQHPIPQDIQSYQFRLVGDMTLKQFIELAGGIVVAIIFYSLPIPSIFKMPLVIFAGFSGVALAFFPLEERPLDEWIGNFFKAVFSPTQYVWEKTPRQPRVFKSTNKAKKSLTSQTQQQKQGTSQPQLEEFLQSLPTKQVKKTALEDSQQINKINQLFDQLQPDQISEGPEVKQQKKQPQSTLKVDVRKLRPQKKLTKDEVVFAATEKKQPPAAQANTQKIKQPTKTNNKLPTPDPKNSKKNQPKSQAQNQEKTTPKPAKQTPEKQKNKQKETQQNSEQKIKNKNPNLKNNQASSEKRQQKKVPTEEVYSDKKSNQPANPPAPPKPEEKKQETKQKPKRKPKVSPAEPLTPPLKFKSPHEQDSQEVEFSKELPLPAKPDIANLLVGMVVSPQKKTVSNALIEVKHASGGTVRALKTNKLGQFFTATPLKDGSYRIITEHPKYNFDIIRVDLIGEAVPPIKIVAKSKKKQTDQPKKEKRVELY